MGSAHSSPDWQSALDRARAHSPFLCKALDRQPELAELLEQGRSGEAMDRARGLGAQSGETGSDIGVALRRERLAISTLLAIGDLAGAFPVEMVMEELSDLADRALDSAITAAMRKRVPDCEPGGMIGIALGKHGARELNYSSDIDPILLFDPETLPRRERDDPGEAAQRYAREIVQLLSNNTAEGFVFRVDLRLRPASEVSPLAIPLEAALSHYESSALAWERAAFIRSRAAAGDIAAGEQFLTAIRPFVWRRSLDFGAIDEISRLTAQIRTTYSGPGEPGPGFNVKQGRGGIREVEFFTQTHQLIHGGRNPSLRDRGTRAALDALADAEIIKADDARELGEAYNRLRTIEHRLQMVEDHQTHTLPAGDALENVARLGGYTDAAALLDDLRGLTETVAGRFDKLINVDDSQPVAMPGGDALKDNLDQLGFPDPGDLSKRIRSWSDGKIRALRSAAAIAAFEAILPELLEALSEATDPMRALRRWEAFLTKTPSAINLFRLLEARPGLFDQLVRVLTLADPLADELSQRPELLDSLIDRSALDLPGEVSELAASMARKEAGDDYERVLDRIRIVTGEKRFSLGLQLIEATHDPLDIAAALSRLAEASLCVAVEAASNEFAQLHGRIRGSELAVIGLGRLGGGALTHASDLDIIYLFSGAHSAGSDGERPLGATLYYNRLAQRVTAALSVPTAQGALYEVDTRLRPQGAQGPLAVNMESFAKYQREDAWTWEHMALTRARVVAGSGDARSKLDTIIASVLESERDPVKLRRDVLTMREDMAAHKPAKGPLDAKLRRGGLVDLEFLVHYLQLRERTAFSPDLRRALPLLMEQDLIPEDIVHAHDMLTRLLVSARLLAPDLSEPARGPAKALANACNCASYNDLVSAFDAARGAVADCWRRTFDVKLETDL
ncbi:bifunctional [glutamine synthetase] adenylyltransferase/[glutamine synthetase]-adenylyl-L-tyrosine phosphorylase [Pontixanthobacter aquaemixtae]|uniref:Bifunctional [glutamine synthetase] adenylyltransferase/[glutamine synthetase]-adenylyl-L-tyrosine phosphorylase n=1 Tax=Pontixanthobacter aquaemixtae TaxID=1958940 RepID=A0A844ZX78_9SPHN|nr:bifunctional [glutamine synthetase] adenylyltransferase/[glutamine synthetase]-adenylyl-L-tyrosine phosphorylase [Pontixanthobacter aquaemixtae]MXO91556.1 bifunctional [glutamine synthetase] adenylyltransferase/[glutamine synthetase]-adenylyl-L-tyrosine phosphorylase [Pontixanthobacter aquaemixtae]